MMFMLVLSFFSWWYGRGWREVASSFVTRLQGIANTFSVTQILRTLFVPWRRIISYGGDGLSAKFRAWADNIFSRAVGFVVRLIVLFAALLLAILVAILSLVELILWPLLPIAAPVLIIMGLV
jgi:hypothetical protein